MGASRAVSEPPKKLGPAGSYRSMRRPVPVFCCKGAMMRHRSFRDVYNDIHGLAAPSRPERLDQQVSGNRNVFKEAAEPTASANLRKRGGRTTEAHRNLTKHDLRLHGVSPVLRADRPSRRANGGRTKHKGVNHVLIAVAPQHGLMGGPVAPSMADAPRPGLFRDSMADQATAVSGSGSFAKGGGVMAGRTYREGIEAATRVQHQRGKDDRRQLRRPV